VNPGPERPPERGTPLAFTSGRVKRLRQLVERPAARKREGAFVVEGPTLVGDAHHPLGRDRLADGVEHALLDVDDVDAGCPGSLCQRVSGVDDVQLEELVQCLTDRLRALDDEPALGHAGRAPVQSPDSLDAR